MLEEEKNKECVEAVPGPAIVLTKEEAEKIKNYKSDYLKQNMETLKKIKQHITHKQQNEEELSK